MADKMMKIAGRGDDGNAKAIRTDNLGNVNVQLKGRIVDEILIFNNVNVNPGETLVQATQNRTDVSGYTKFTVAGSVDASHSFKVAVDPKDSSGLYVGTKDIFSGAGTNFITDPFELGVTILQFRITNNDTVAHTYRLMLFARRV